jgi:hypothetical protein
MEQTVCDSLCGGLMPALHYGAVVITGNGRDFARIEKHTPVRWMLPAH